MCGKNSLLTRFTDKSIAKNTTSNSCAMKYGVFWVAVACACMLSGQSARAAGGCGSVCLPLEALDTEKIQLRQNQFRIGITTEHADFDNFREGGSDINNPGGNKAFISQTTLFLDYGFTRKFTASLLIPYVRKRQETSKFGTRIAEGIGDISVFGRYEILTPSIRTEPSVSIGLGLKFPSGSISEPNDSTLLPPAFQTGSGAYDIVPTVSFYQDLNGYILFGSVFARIPLEKNSRGYKFGNEIELNTGVEYPLPVPVDWISVLMGISYLHAQHDRDANRFLPARLRNGTEVLNTGGDFLDFVPGFRIEMGRSFSLQARFFVPVFEDWNGNRATNVGQVAPDLTTQINLVYSMTHRTNKIRSIDRSLRQ